VLRKVTMAEAAPPQSAGEPSSTAAPSKHGRFAVVAVAKPHKPDECLDPSGSEKLSPCALTLQ